MHEYFHGREYPEPAVLERIFRALDDTARDAADLRHSTGLDEEVFASALEKLWIHGGARVTPDDEVSRGEAGWRTAYPRRREHKAAQLDQMLRTAQSHGCRMLSLVRHFGDQKDSGEPCAQCDACAPESGLMHRSRAATAEEAAIAHRLIQALEDRPGLTAGQLHREACAPLGASRRELERLLGGMARSGLVEVEEDSFQKDGRTIRFSRVFLTRAGSRAGSEGELTLRLPDVARRAGREGSSRGSRQRRAEPRTARTTREPPLVSQALVAELKAWRLGEARKRRVPAFRILTDRALDGLAEARPSSEAELLSVPGVGPSIAGRYGKRILSILRRHGLSR
jgi:DNA topoisomerase-3